MLASLLVVPSPLALASLLVSAFKVSTDLWKVSFGVTKKEGKKGEMKENITSQKVNSESVPVCRWTPKVMFPSLVSCI